MIFCTTIWSDQAAEAVVLGNSLKQHMPECTFIVCLIEKEAIPDLEREESIDEVILGEKIGIARFDRFMNRFHPAEAAALCKAPFLSYVYDHFEEEQCFLHLEPKIRAFSTFPEIEKAFGLHSILFAPHIVSPPSIDQVIWKDHAEIEWLRNGVLNEGFIGVKRSRSAEKFLKWWNDRVIHSAAFDPVTRFSSCQKWLTHALSIFKDVHILKNPGYLVEYWNVGSQRLTRSGQTYSVDKTPLRFFNFSYRLHNYQHSDVVLSQLVRSYEEELARYKHSFPERGRWSYDPTRKKRHRGRH